MELFFIVFRVRDFWTEQGPSEILLKLKRKEITLFRAAADLNVTPQTLSNYLLSMSVRDNEPALASITSDEEADSILPDVSTNLKITQDVPVIKKEKFISIVANLTSDSDHSDKPNSH